MAIENFIKLKKFIICGWLTTKITDIALSLKLKLIR